MNNLFDKWKNIEQYQQLTDTIFKVVDAKDSVVFLSTKEKQIFHFLDLQNFINKREFSKILNHKKINDKDNRLIFLTYSSMNSLNSFKIDTNYRLFFIETDNLPFKYKDLIYPYSIEIEKDSILSIHTGNINL